MFLPVRIVIHILSWDINIYLGFFFALRISRLYYSVYLFVYCICNTFLIFASSSHYSFIHSFILSFIHYIHSVSQSYIHSFIRITFVYLFTPLVHLTYFTCFAANVTKPMIETEQQRKKNITNRSRRVYSTTGIVLYKAEWVRHMFQSAGPYICVFRTTNNVCLLITGTSDWYIK